MIEFKNVSFSYESGSPVLDDISFCIDKGESVGLIGANGAGKSTILKTLLGLLPSTGTVEIDGVPMIKKNFAKLRKKMGYVLQDSDNQLFMPTVYEDMIFAPLNYGMSMEEAERRVDEALAATNISHLKHRQTHKMSGGEKRMACIATILAMEPEFLMMDEPSIALDPFNRRTLINTINKLEMTKIIASHDLDMILETCNRVILLSGSKIVADGLTKEILYNKELLENNRLELPLCLCHPKS